MMEALEDKSAIPFRVPEGIRLVRVNATTGKPAVRGDKRIIWEAFKAADQISGGGRVIDGTDTGGVSTISIDRPKNPATYGTGGLY